MNRRVDPDQLEAEAEALMGIEPQAPTQDTPPADPPGEPAEDPIDPVDPPPEDDAEGEPTENDPPPAIPPEEEDELKGLTVKNAEERIRNAQKRMQQATQEAAELRRKQASHDQVVSDKDAEIRRLQDDLQQAKAVKATPTPAAAPVTDASLQRLQEEYPDLAPVLQELTASRATNQHLSVQLGELKSRLDETDRKVDTRSEKELIADHLTAIRKVHPDMDKIRDSDDFKGWRDRQPPVVQTALSTGSADDVIWALNTYKDQVGLAKRRGKIGAAAAAAVPEVRTQRQPPAGSKRTFTQTQIEAMSPEEFAANEAEIDKALAEGRVT